MKKRQSKGSPETQLVSSSIETIGADDMMYPGAWESLDCAVVPRMTRVTVDDLHQISRLKLG